MVGHQLLNKQRAYNRRMDDVELLPVAVREALDRGAIVVTGNQRAARALARGYDLRCRTQGLRSWRPPDVLAWDAWTTRLWHELLVSGDVSELLLNPSQEHSVWRGVLEADEGLASLKTLDALAEMAAEAWALVCKYDGLGRLRGSGGSSDARAFQRWASAFERVCRSKGLVSSAQLEQRLREKIEAGAVKVRPGGIALVGLDKMTPAQGKLVEALRDSGWMITEVKAQVLVEEKKLTVAPDEHDELRIAARWVRECLESRPRSRVAVIVPGLETQRSEIDRVFREVLAPELQDIRAGNGVGPFEFSVGVALSETPMVARALDLLRWVVGRLPLERVSELLLSPYVGGARERTARAEFDAYELRKRWMLRPEFELEEMVAVVEGAKRRRQLGELLGSLRGMAAVKVRLHGVAASSHAEWAERIREFLDTAGWGAGEGESSVEFQTRRRWENALDEMATLDFDGVKVEYEEALARLDGIARRMMFAQESREAPVQVMGPLEAAGGTFDAVWFLRGGELSWPLGAVSSSLLPWGLQRDLGVPGTDAARDAEDARRTTERIAGSAERVIFSYARETKDGRQKISSVIAGLGLEEVAAEDLIGVAKERVVVAVEEIEDAERVGPLPDRVLRGGAKILQSQAACGFRAFAEQRLWAAEVEAVTLGMDARESGTIVHKALELFWDEVRTQDALRAMTRDERRAVLTRSIATALQRTEESVETPWDGAYVEMQKERLRRLIDGWLDVELKRGLPFEVKLSEKEFRDVRVGPLRLSVRMDRVDVVDGGEVLIDYKTGKTEVSAWLSERPDAPQLPLYAILSDAERLQGVAFGVVRAGEDMKLTGYSVADGVLVGRSAKMKEAATLEAQVDRWRHVLEGLAMEFAHGDARVKPKQYPKTCAHCGQRLLCRVDATLLTIVDEEDEGEDVGLG